jgi:multidrug transporter EmrE-like cation transporter
MRSLLPVFASIFLAALGQLTLKYAMMGSPLAVSSPIEALRSILSRPFVYIGMTFYAGSSFLWIIALSRLPLSYMYPFTALMLVLITVAGAFLFHEPLNVWRVSGVVLICSGLLLIARS